MKNYVIVSIAFFMCYVFPISTMEIQLNSTNDKRPNWNKLAVCCLDRRENIELFQEAVKNISNPDIQTSLLAFTIGISREMVSADTFNVFPKNNISNDYFDKLTNPNTLSIAFTLAALNAGAVPNARCFRRVIFKGTSHQNSAKTNLLTLFLEKRRDSLPSVTWASSLRNHNKFKEEDHEACILFLERRLKQPTN